MSGLEWGSKEWEVSLGQRERERRELATSVIPPKESRRLNKSRGDFVEEGEA